MAIDDQYPWNAQADPVLTTTTTGFMQVWPNTYDALKRHRVEELYRFLNQTGQSGYVNARVVINEIAKLLELPEEVVK